MTREHDAAYYEAHFADRTAIRATVEAFSHPSTVCRAAGHVEGCQGKAGGAHVLLPGWIAYEDTDGSLIEIEVAS